MLIFEIWKIIELILQRETTREALQGKLKFELYTFADYFNT